MPRYKRTFDEAELGTPSTPAVQPEHEDKLNELRNMWEFASLMQYIFLFGSVVKIGDDFDIEVRISASSHFVHYTRARAG